MDDYDRHGIRWFVLIFIILGVYLAFFNFDVSAAYNYTITQAGGLLNLFGL